jgi:catechol-2,3-dioxygenase
MHHLQLAAVDVPASVQFYTKYFGFRRTSGEDQNHVMLRNNESFMLSLIKISQRAFLPNWFHVGYAVGSRERVKEIYKDMQENGIEMYQNFREDIDWAAFYCRDPAGIIVEVSWDRPHPN